MGRNIIVEMNQQRITGGYVASPSAPPKSRNAGLHISPGRYTEILKEARIFINTKKFPALKLLAFKKGHKKQILFFFGGENFFISYLLKPLINIFFSKSPLISNFHGGDFAFPCHFTCPCDGKQVKSRFSYF